MMETGTSFDTTKELLPDILKDISSGKIQLPDFQRGWIWDDNHVKSLLASVSVSFPIGAVMLLGTGNPSVRLRPRLVEGVELSSPQDPEWLILDGQQRLTSLYQALKLTEPVKTKDARGKDIQRWYYLHIPTTLDPDADQEDAIFSIPSDKKLRNFRGEVINDYSTTELECKADLLPLPIIFDFGKLTHWQSIYTQNDSERHEKWLQLGQSVIPRFQKYHIPLIKMLKETPKEAVCQVFEKVNTGGVSLTVFELLTATFAADDYNLRDDWVRRGKQLKQLKVLSSVQSDDVLQAISLLASRKRRLEDLSNEADQKRAPAITCKRRDLLKLSLEEYRAWADPVTEGFERSARFMHSQRIYSARDLPYRTQLVPLASILTLLGTRGDNDGIRSMLAKWFWCGVFGELYGGATETRFAKDVPQVISWIDGGLEPDTVNDAHFSPTRLYSLRTRNSAAYKGVFNLLIKNGGLDFRTGEEITIQNYFDDKIDIHHIFPQAFCREHEIDPKRCDCIVNKTGISAKTNRIIGGKAPSEYLGKLQSSANIREERMKSILNSHLIDQETLSSDNFDDFYKKREEALISRIEKAMGKPVVVGIQESGFDSESVDFQSEDEES